MSTNEGDPVLGENAVLEVSGSYQPIHLEDTLGAIFLGIFAMISLMGWMYTEARYRKLLKARS